MSHQAISASVDANRRVFRKGSPIAIDDLPPITVESINASIEESRTPDEWAKEVLFAALIESDIDITNAMPHLTKIIGRAQAAVRKTMRASA